MTAFGKHDVVVPFTRLDNLQELGGITKQANRVFLPGFIDLHFLTALGNRSTPTLKFVRLRQRFMV